MPAVAFCMRPSTSHRPAVDHHREPSRAAQSHWQRRDRGSGPAGHVRFNAADGRRRRSCGRPTHGLPPAHASPSAAEGRSRIGAILVFGVSWLEIRSPGAPSRPHPTLSLCLSVSSHLPIGALAAPSARLFLVSFGFFAPSHCDITSMDASGIRQSKLYSRIGA